MTPRDLHGWHYERCANPYGEYYTVITANEQSTTAELEPGSDIVKMVVYANTVRIEQDLDSPQVYVPRNLIEAALAEMNAIRAAATENHHHAD